MFFNKANFLLCKHQPDCCLAEGEKGPKLLLCSNRPKVTSYGKVYQLVSLSSYFEAIYRCWNKNDISDIGSEKHLFLPVRQFNTQSLFDSCKNNLLHRLMDVCSLVIIHDCDLQSKTIRNFLPERIYFYNLTKRLHLTGSFCYVISKNICRFLGPYQEAK